MFKARTSHCFKILKELEDQSTAMDYLKKSQTKTFDTIYNIKKQLCKKFNDQVEANQGILKSYVEGINELKKYELHSALKKDGKSHLIDIYYDEA